VPVTTLPGWLQAFVKVNPVSHLVSATRALANQGVVTSQAGWTLLAGLVVIVIFAPLSVRSYRRHM
jgi:ABC-2 type transport system permease protein